MLFTGKHSQLVVMCLQPLEEIGNEVHPNVDQFFRIEEGKAKFVFNDKEGQVVGDGDAVVVLMRVLSKISYNLLLWFMSTFLYAIFRLSASPAF